MILKNPKNQKLKNPQNRDFHQALRYVKLEGRRMIKENRLCTHFYEDLFQYRNFDWRNQGNEKL